MDGWIALDLDGVVFDYAGYLREKLMSATGRYVPEDHRDWSFAKSGWFADEQEWLDFHANLAANGMFTSMDPITGAVEGVSRLRSDGWKIKVVTSRFLPGVDVQRCKDETKESLDAIGLRYDDIVYLENKEQAGCDIYIDDSPMQVKRLSENGDCIICYRYPYNDYISHKADAVCESWDEIVAYIESLALPAIK
jgi:hypothetical protein